MKHLILHIGQTKTGSTALQHFFLQNRESLEQYGIAFYEAHHSYSGSMQVANGAFLLQDALRLLMGGSCSNAEILEEEISLFQTFSSCRERLLLTDELFCETAAARPALWGRVRDRLAEIFGEKPDIRVILYLRRQDEWLLVLYSHTRSLLPSTFRVCC